jgi:hypothetical protein
MQTADMVRINVRFEKRATDRGIFRAARHPRAGLDPYWISTENTLRHVVRHGDRLEIADLFEGLITEISGVLTAR